MLTETLNWLILAKNLHEGNSLRIDCLFCEDTRRSLKLRHTDQGYSAYCFRCKEKYFEGHGERSISKLNLGKATKKFCITNIELPSDFTLDIPWKEAIWLYKSSIFASTQVQYNIGWSNKLQRIIIPVYKDNKLVYLQARSTKRQPKYLNKECTNKSSILFESQASEYIITKDVCIVTEAILSAIRVGRYVPTFSSLGSNLSDAQAYQLSKYKKIIIWYDPDEAGLFGSYKALHKLGSIHNSVINYRSKYKPKQYTNEELINIIKQLKYSTTGVYYESPMR